ncbi:uncharacterized protein KD926_002181 [Aspergillus affinis]|uniref:uncharacterized protein n=1 Tax=Aspergillus affinis TaxID=1070780 RepID=UPI0022FDC1E8|nr:uncharacterized protein KD926_002181 [Aspergillus affinis]KAI9036213.1 hypothetical protein KD926_002181 [Aspergillus affinis]
MPVENYGPTDQYRQDFYLVDWKNHVGNLPFTTFGYQLSVEFYAPPDQYTQDFHPVDWQNQVGNLSIYMGEQYFTQPSQPAHRPHGHPAPFGFQNPVVDHGPTDRNAQVFYPVAYRIHVGNLPRNMDEQTMKKALREIFDPIGRCFITVNIYQKYPTAFVQFTALQDLQMALGLNNACNVGEQVLRIEAAKGPRNGKKTPIYRKNVNGELEKWNGY